MIIRCQLHIGGVGKGHLWEWSLRKTVSKQEPCVNLVALYKSHPTWSEIQSTG